jgi:hypothetical protein
MSQTVTISGTISNPTRKILPAKGSLKTVPRSRQLVGSRCIESMEDDPVINGYPNEFSQVLLNVC